MNTSDEHTERADKPIEFEPFGTIDISDDLREERRIYVFFAVMYACVVASFIFSAVWAVIH